MAAIQLIAICMLTLCLANTSQAEKRYDGYQLLKIDLANAKHTAIIDKILNDTEFDIWREGRSELDVLVPPHRLNSLKEQLRENELDFNVMVNDIQRDIDEEKARLSVRRTGNLPIDYNDFNTYEQIVGELNDLVARCPSGLTCQVVVHGRTYENRDITGIRIFRTDRTQKKVWIDATIHAREWLATAVHMNIIGNIVDNYATDSVLRTLVDKYDWNLLPVVNPDGYAETWIGDRLWRKNRSPNAGSTCLGTDLNRNFDHKWGTDGASSQPCAITYHGFVPASEVEVRALQSIWQTMSADLLLTVNLHTYGRMWLTPWSYQVNGVCYVGPDDSDTFRVANAAANAIEATYNTVWTRGPFCTVLYPGSGTSLDFGKDNAGVKYTFLPELRGSSFIVPKTEIEPAFIETWNGIKAAIVAIEPSSRV